MTRKNNRLNETISLIQQALRSCGDDFAILPIRANLLAALREAKHVGKKRLRREQQYQNALQEAAEKAKTLHHKWWQQIEENVRKAIKEDAQNRPDLPESV